jgi:hypothetical protein
MIPRRLNDYIGSGKAGIAASVVSDERIRDVFLCRRRKQVGIFATKAWSDQRFELIQCSTLAYPWSRTVRTNSIHSGRPGR